MTQKGELQESIAKLSITMLRYKLHHQNLRHWFVNFQRRDCMLSTELSNKRSLLRLSKTSWLGVHHIDSHETRSCYTNWTLFLSVNIIISHGDDYFSFREIMPDWCNYFSQWKIIIITRDYDDYYFSLV